MARYYRSMEDGMSQKGTVNESSLFGDNTKGHGSYKYAEALKRYTFKSNGGSTTGRWSFNDALSFVREVQIQDPMNPQRKFMRDLRDAVIRKLSLDQKDIVKNLGIYSAIRTPLDFYHGVDAFIELRTNDGELKIVTMDATLNKEKLDTERIKANVLIGEVPEHIDHPQEYKDFIDRIADQIVLCFKGSSH
ncbi:MAG: hypothetical protein AAB795_03235 [Patescibacteria group bacterium]